ncbi:MAG: hypothetical protein GY711_16185 [bacterium]|nr:hypothetical protein [bacterium]
MNLTLIATLAGLALAIVVSASLGGAEGTGVAGGYLFGGALGLLGVSYQNHILRTRPSQVMNASMVAFLFKLFGALLGVLSLRFLEPLARVAEWRSFLLAYAAAVLLSLVFGSIDISRALKRRSAH